MTDTDAETPERWDAPSAGPAGALKPEKPCPAQGSFILEPLEVRDSDSIFGSAVPVPELDSESELAFAPSVDEDLVDDPDGATETEPPLPWAPPVAGYAGIVRERLIEMRAALHDLLELVDADDAASDLRAASGE
ncbi:MAG: hypothetical protein H6729_03370 [Deltaproteobacteria bacterium]|nr:hypothetical protein [Deltaproteobacteria bacterium]